MSTTGTQPEGDLSASTGTGDGQTPPASSAAASPQVDPATLANRISGLDAKVTSLQAQAKAAEAARAAAEQKLSDYESGKVQADEALRAQIAAKDAELERVRREAALSRVANQYPETFGVLGEAAASLTEDQLAASEARMSGASAQNPPPVGNNPARAAGGQKSIDDMSAAELRKHLLTFDPGVMFVPRS